MSVSEAFHVSVFVYDRDRVCVRAYMRVYVCVSTWHPARIPCSLLQVEIENNLKTYERLKDEWIVYNSILFSGDSRRQLTVGKMMSPWNSSGSGGDGSSLS